jgi:hypothetical protein
LSIPSSLHIAVRRMTHDTSWHSFILEISLKRCHLSTLARMLVVLADWHYYSPPLLLGTWRGCCLFMAASFHCWLAADEAKSRASY